MTSPGRSRGGSGHPPHVYRRRQLTVLTVTVLLVWGGVELFSGGDNDTDASPTAAEKSPTSSPSPSPSSTPEPEPSPEPTKKNEVVRVDLPAPRGECEAETVKASPAVDSGEHTKDSVPIQLRLATTGDQACTLDLSKQQLLVMVTDGDEDVWSSSACAQVPDKQVTLRPSWAASVDVEWSGRESVKNCDKQGDYVAPGTYTVQAAVIGGEPGQAKFELGKD